MCKKAHAYVLRSLRRRPPAPLPVPAAPTQGSCAPPIPLSSSPACPVISAPLRPVFDCK